MRSPLFYLTSLANKEKKALKVLHDHTTSVILERRKQLLEDKAETFVENESKNIYFEPKNRKAFLDLLLQSTNENGEPLSNLDIREEVDTFMFEGHDTTTSAISFSLYCIARYPHVQKKLINEIKSVLGTDKRMPTMQQLSDLNYLNLVIKEVLRLYPPVPMIARKLKNDIFVDGKRIPSGTNLDIGIICTQRNEQFFDRALEFIPERFENEVTNDGDNVYKYIPFSAGSRNCIGENFN